MSTKRIIMMVLQNGTLAALLCGGVACSRANFASMASEASPNGPTTTAVDPGAPVCVNLGRTFQPGEIFTTACASGQTGSIVNTCQTDGSFARSGSCVTPNPTPTPVTCRNNGVVYQIGQSFTAPCASGQTGSIVNTCQANGSFSPTNTCQTPAPTCNSQDILVTMSTLIRTIPTTEDAIAQACADGAVTAQGSYPSNGGMAATRFFNTCGNRYCQNVLGATSGRVIEDNQGQATVSCIYNVTPTTNVSNLCQAATQIKIQQRPWIGYPFLSRAQLAQDCADDVVSAAQSIPTDGDSMTRWIFACGNRECVKQGWNGGRVIEDNGVTAYLECTREEVFNDLGGGEAAHQFNTTPQDVANYCVDGFFPTPSSSLPVAGNDSLLRFMNTCGNRYCTSHGFRQGRVNEVNTSVAVVRCTK